MTRGRRRWAVAGALVAVLLVAVVSLPWLMLDDAPAVEPPPQFRRSDLAWVKSLLQKHDPRGQTPHTLRTILLDEEELNRLLNYAVELRRVTGVAAELRPAGATLTATVEVPRNPYGRYLNLTAEVAESPGGVRVVGLQLGSLPLPGALADALARRVHQRLRQDATYAALADAVSQITFAENQAAIDYHWRPELLARVERKSADLLIPPGDRALMLDYAQRLDALIRQHPRYTTIPLVRVAAPLFEATGRQPGNEREENRAALTALAAYVSGISLPKLLQGDSASIRRAPPVLLSLHGRRDFAEHFLISAALSVNGGSRLANAMGLVKEEEDAAKGSGFSFTDLAADRAGVRLGERATGDDAAQVARQLAAVRRDSDLVPDIRDLPEFMPQAEFDRRFGPVGSARYNAVIARIDARLAAHPLIQK